VPPSGRDVKLNTSITKGQLADEFNWRRCNPPLDKSTNSNANANANAISNSKANSNP